MKKIIALLACTLTLVACKGSSLSYKVFQWSFDEKAHTLHAKIVAADGKIVKEVTIPIEAASNGAYFYKGASDTVQYHPATDSIIYQIRNRDSYKHRLYDDSLDFAQALFRTDFQGSAPVQIYAENVLAPPDFGAQGEESILWSAAGDKLVAIKLQKYTPSLVIYDLAQNKLTKECTDLPDYQGTTYIYGKGNEVMYVSIKTESRGKVFINMDSCAVRRETYKLPEKDDTNFSTALSGINLSPDGKWIVYRYFLIDAATGQKQKMYGAPEPKSEGINVNFSWSSDSKYVVYSSYNTGNVYVYDVEKNGTKKLPIPAKNGATFLPNSHDVYLHDYPNGVEKNTVFNIDSWTGEERTLPMGQAIP